MAIEQYRARAGRFGQERDRLTQQWNLIGNVRLVAFVAAVALIIWGIVQGAGLLWAGGLVVLAAACLGAAIGLYEVAGPRDVFERDSAVDWNAVDEVATR